MTLNKKTVIYVSGGVLVLAVFYALFWSAPRDFPVGARVQIEPGSNLRSISSDLKSQHLIRSRLIFEFLVAILGGEKHIISADYLFESRLSVLEVAKRIGSGEHSLPPVSVTIPEGFNLRQIGETFAPKLQNFDENKFLLAAKDKEGYLFPNTYFFLATDDQTEVIKAMSDNFKKKITPLLPEIASSGKTEKDIITMASIIEREAEGSADRGIIAGILWKRISLGMPLQVDAAPETYKTKGLPEGPIGNPGLEAIKSAIHPQNSPYLYYLHGKNGVIHYAENFAEHLQNKIKYLK